MKIIAPTRPVLPDRDAYISEISDIWQTYAMTNNGAKLQKFQELLKYYTHCDNLDLFVNGHTALFLAIKSMNFPKGAEVITSPFTFVSTTNAICQNDLVPVFGDIDDSYNLDSTCIESLVTERTCAIVTPHIFGIPCDVDGIEKIARKHNLKVIYDGAQAFGTKVNGKSIACFGDATMFSFHAIKVFNSIEGGMLSYKDEALHKLLELYRNFGISYSENGNDVEVCGINGKMDEFRVAMGIVNLSGLDKEIEKRKALAQRYIALLNRIDGISTYNYKPDIDYNYAYFPIKIHSNAKVSRDELFKRLKDMGVGTRKLYDTLTCDTSFYKSKNFKKSIANAESITKICLDLPLYGTLTEDDIDYVCDSIKTIMQGA